MSAVEQARQAYDEARAWRDFLVDHPDKSVPVDVYRAQLADAMAAVDRTHRGMTGASL